MRNFDQRLKKLERQLAPEDPVTLIMPDGTQEELPMTRGGMLELFRYLINNEDSRKAKLLRASIEILEPGGSHLLELARALLHGPAVEETGKN